ncbi:conserved hypothetical protein [Vibrio chagasii]|nr:conserved hypothetical protein [Vibrio chagasii]CAH7335081.1 conserved hypothetical protein [Vibrio chagasii]CAH7466208.1 conserved hypothetical protein [Vibrio chagasii]
MNTVFLRDGHIVIHYDYHGKLHDNDYPIPLSDCNTETRLLQMVYHLSQKTWITPELLTQFIKLACEENRLTSPL